MRGDRTREPAEEVPAREWLTLLHQLLGTGLEGAEGPLAELDNGRVHDIKPGTLYAMNEHDRHRIRAKTRMRLIATFTPPRTGEEVHDVDGSL